MKDLQLSERIKQRISDSSRDYSPPEQRAELILRNQRFFEELYDIDERWHPICDKDIRKELFFDFRTTFITKAKCGTFTERDIGYLYDLFVPKKRLAPSKDGDRWFRTTEKHQADFACRLRSLKGQPDKVISSWFKNKLVRQRRRSFYPDDPEWTIFCERWRIDCDWDSYSTETLKDHVFSSPRVISWNRLTERDVEWWALPKNPLDDLVAGIIIQIDPWTTKKDLEDLAPAIARAKKEIFGYAERETRNFGRDLCWYDLHYLDEFSKKSYGEIAEYWRTWGGGRSHKRITIIQAIKRIQGYIDRLTPLL